MDSGSAQKLPNQVDVAIVGGGIVGCATAYYLARKGASVALFERGLVASEQSSRAWGLVRQQSRHPDEVQLAAEASRIWPTLDKELGADVEFVRDGILVPAENERDEERLADSARTSLELGVDVRMIGANEIRKLLPDASIFWRTGLLAPNDGHAEPRAATIAYANAAMREGAAILENTTVLEIETTNDHVTGIRTRERIYRCSAALCAAGIGTTQLCRRAGVDVPIQVMRASVAQTAPTKLRSGALTAVWSPSVSFRPKRDGTFYISNGYRGIDGEHDLTLESFRRLRNFLPTLLANWRTVKLNLGSEFIGDIVRKIDERRRFEPLPEPRVNHSLLKKYEKAFYEVYPQLTGLGMAKTWAGRIDATPDLLPIIEAVNRPAGYYIAAGFNGHGFALAPAVAKALAELIHDGSTTQNLSPFRLARFSEGKAAIRRNAL
jgi:glycine/D-amino acid oxidase-like deaminating enzyme